MVYSLIKYGFVKLVILLHLVLQFGVVSCFAYALAGIGKGLVTAQQDRKNRTQYACALRLRFSPHFLRSRSTDKPPLKISLFQFSIPKKNFFNLRIDPTTVCT